MLQKRSVLHSINIFEKMFCFYSLFVALITFEILGNAEVCEVTSGSQ